MKLVCIAPASTMHCVSNTMRCLRLLTLTPKLKVSKFYSVKNSVNVDFIFPLSKGRSKSSGVLGLRGPGVLLSGRNMNIASQVISHRHLSILQRQSINRSMDNSRNFSNLDSQLLHESSKLFNQKTMTSWSRRFVATKEITKNMTLLSKEPIKGEVDPKTLEIKQPSGNPLVLMMAWLMARQKHLKKYAEIYTDMGFDVIVVHVTPWQLLWPVKGTQVVAADALKFMENNKLYAPIVVHGFSVGAYQIGEVMLQMARDINRYKGILDRIVCQIWDSAADITEIPAGVPKSIFPKNPRMQSALRNYILYHMKTFHNQATIHYMRSSQMFHSTLIKQPALFFVSENDNIGPPSSNHAVRENWERANIKVTFKCWQHSQHAAHLVKHREEYLECLFKHLESCGAIDSIGLKTRAKL